LGGVARFEADNFHDFDILPTTVKQVRQTSPTLDLCQYVCSVSCCRIL
jgi:hypothetical protein